MDGMGSDSFLPSLRLQAMLLVMLLALLLLLLLQSGENGEERQQESFWTRPCCWARLQRWCHVQIECTAGQN